MGLLAVWTPGLGEIIVILAILLLLFGSTKLPKLARGLGSSVTEFRKGLRGESDEDEKKKLDGGKGEGDSGKDDEAKSSD
ncbi:MAG: twin-arginine translocase TatA/TatE family subunit [Planctomycetota bacterium]